jgi:hypothetical protein
MTLLVLVCDKANGRRKASKQQSQYVRGLAVIDLDGLNLIVETPFLSYPGLMQ